jgi:hypothetical protein
MNWKYFAGWFALLVTAVVNGAIRDGLYKDAVGELAAHQISTATGILLFALLIRWMVRRWPIPDAKTAWRIGLVWVGMTICFEFGFFHYVVGHPWSRLLHDYNIFDGRVWVLVLIWTGVAPWVFYRMQSRQ